MPKQNQSFFHKVNDKLTLNLAEVAAVSDVTDYYLTIPDNHYVKPCLASGEACRVTLLRYSGLYGSEGGREFDITRAEMTVLQDALDWYNRHFAQTE